MSENEIYSADKNKKSLLPRAMILAAVFLLFLGALGYIYYFNPAFLSDNLQKNPTSNNPIRSIAAQSLNGGGADQLNNSQSLTADTGSVFGQQLIALQKDIETLQDKLTKLNSSDKLNLSGGELTGELEIQDTLTLNNTAKTNSLIPQKDDEYDLGSEDKGFDNAFIHQLWGSSILTIGDNDTSHNLTNNNDLLISGNLEVDGIAYFDSGLNAGGQLISNLADPLNPQDAVTKAYYEANTPTGVFSRTGTTITPTTAGDAINFTNSLLTFDSLQTFGGSTLNKLGYLSNASSDIQVQLTGLDTDKQDSLTLGNITGTYINVSGGTGAIVGSGVSISLPQSIATTSSPTFAGAILNGIFYNNSLLTSTFLGGLDIGGALGVTGDTTLMGNLDVGGDLTVGNNIINEPTEILNSATASFSSTTGTPTYGSSHGMVVTNGVVVLGQLAAGNCEIKIIKEDDMSLLATINLKTTFGGGTSCWTVGDLAAHGNIIYGVAHRTTGDLVGRFIKLDVSDPINYKLTYSDETANVSTAHASTVYGRFGFAASYIENLSIITVWDISGTPTLLSSLQTTHTIHSLYADDGYLYVGDINSTAPAIQVYSLAELLDNDLDYNLPTSPAETVVTPTSPIMLVPDTLFRDEKSRLIVPTYDFAITTTHIFIYDATDPTNLTLLGSKDVSDDMNSGIEKIYVAGDLLFAIGETAPATFAERTGIFNISDPTNITLVDTIIRNTANASAVDFYNGYIYTAAADGDIVANTKVFKHDINGKTKVGKIEANLGYIGALSVGNDFQAKNGYFQRELHVGSGGISTEGALSGLTSFLVSGTDRTKNVASENYLKGVATPSIIKNVTDALFQSSQTKLIINWMSPDPTSLNEIDYSGTGNTFTYNNVDAGDTGTLETGGRYVALGGTNEYLSGVAGDDDFELGSNTWTIFGYVKGYDVVSGEFGGIMGKMDDGVGAEWNLYIDVNQKLTFDFIDNADSKYCQAHSSGASSPFSPNNWHFITITKTAHMAAGIGNTDSWCENIQIYINGVAATISTEGDLDAGSVYTATNAAPTIGYFASIDAPAGGEYYKGSLGFLSLANGRGVSATEATYLYNSFRALYGN